MKKSSFPERPLGKEQWMRIIDILSWIALMFSIVLSYILNILVLDVLLSIVGWLLFTVGMYIHYLSHLAHPRAHKSIEEIDYIAQKGVYAWIRHPGYLGLTLVAFGIAIAFGSFPSIIIALILAVHYYMLACKEEKWMLKKFGIRYEEYMRKVPDRFVPIRKTLAKLRSRSI